MKFWKIQFVLQLYNSSCVCVLLQHISSARLLLRINNIRVDYFIFTSYRKPIFIWSYICEMKDSKVFFYFFMMSCMMNALLVLIYLSSFMLLIFARYRKLLLQFSDVNILKLLIKVFILSLQHSLCFKSWHNKTIA